MSRAGGPCGRAVQEGRAGGLCRRAAQADHAGVPCRRVMIAGSAVMQVARRAGTIYRSCWQAVLAAQRALRPCGRAAQAGRLGGRCVRAVRTSPLRGPRGLSVRARTTTEQRARAGRAGRPCGQAVREGHVGRSCGRAMRAVLASNASGRAGQQCGPARPRGPRVRAGCALDGRVTSISFCTLQWRCDRFVQQSLSCTGVTCCW